MEIHLLILNDKTSAKWYKIILICNLVCIFSLLNCFMTYSKEACSCIYKTKILNDMYQWLQLTSETNITDLILFSWSYCDLAYISTFIPLLISGDIILSCQYLFEYTKPGFTSTQSLNFKSVLKPFQFYQIKREVTWISNTHVHLSTVYQNINVSEWYLKYSRNCPRTYNNGQQVLNTIQDAKAGIVTGVW